MGKPAHKHTYTYTTYAMPCYRHNVTRGPCVLCDEDADIIELYSVREIESLGSEARAFALAKKSTLVAHQLGRSEDRFVTFLARALLCQKQHVALSEYKKMKKFDCYGGGLKKTKDLSVQLWWINERVHELRFSASVKDTSFFLGVVAALFRIRELALCTKWPKRNKNAWSKLERILELSIGSGCRWSGSAWPHLEKLPGSYSHQHNVDESHAMHVSPLLSTPLSPIRRDADVVLTTGSDLRDRALLCFQRHIIRCGDFQSRWVAEFLVSIDAMRFSATCVACRWDCNLIPRFWMWMCVCSPSQYLSCKMKWCRKVRQIITPNNMKDASIGVFRVCTNDKLRLLSEFLESLKLNQWDCTKINNNSKLVRVCEPSEEERKIAEQGYESSYMNQYKRLKLSTSLEKYEFLRRVGMALPS